MERYTPCVHSKLGHLQAVIGMEVIYYRMPELLDLNVLKFLVYRSCMLASSLRNIFRDFGLIGYIDNSKGFNAKKNY